VLVAELPPLLTTTTSTVPAVWDGETAVIWVGETTVKLLAFVPPNVTWVTLVKFVPLTVTLVPPEPVPVPGETLLTVGAVEAYVYRSLELTAEDPADVTTVTSTAPAACVGAMAVMEVGELTLNEVATDVPKRTDDTLVNPVPVMLTDVPPFVLPEVGPTPVTVGALAVYVNWSAEVTGELPVVVSTTTSTTPALWAGAIAMIIDEDVT
jgi:hypothetical protein